MYAARQNAMESVSALADMKVDLNATTKQEGTTALQIAVINIHYDLANLLLERGADPNARASIRKGFAFSRDPSPHEYRDVTPLGWGRRFHDQGMVSDGALRLIAERGGHE